MVNMTLFQIQLLVAIRLDVNAAMHIVNLCGVIVQMEQLKLGTGGLTMAKYIDRNAFLEHMKKTNRYFDVKHDIENFPAADVAPVVHGQWKTNSDRPDTLICSICKCGFDMWKHDPHNYCPNCGTKMDER